jgi:hypothetical protein
MIFGKDRRGGAFSATLRHGPLIGLYFIICTSPQTLIAWPVMLAPKGEAR